MNMRLILMFLYCSTFFCSAKNEDSIIRSAAPVQNQKFKKLFESNGSYWYLINGKLDPADAASLNKSGMEIFDDDSIFALSNSVDDFYYNRQWNMKAIGLTDLVFPDLSKIQSTWKEQAKMYILDSGAPADWNGKITHPELTGPGTARSMKNRFIVGANYAKIYQLIDTCGCGRSDTVYIEWQNKHWDDIGHSTHVAGIAAANSNNEIGVAGVDWTSEVTFVKVIRDGSGWGRMSWLIQAILDADKESEERQMDIVVNLSLGSVFPYRPLEELIDYLNSKRDELGYGLILVCAAGNFGVETLSYPAMYSHYGKINPQGYKNIISVGAVVIDSLQRFRRASYSNYGNDIDIWAPGGSAPDVYYSEEDDIYRVKYDSLSIFSLAPDSVELRPFYPHMVYPDDHPYDYFYQSGTSMAAPHVTGAVTRFLDYYGKGYNLEQLKTRLQKSGKEFTYKELVELDNGRIEGNHEFSGSVLYLPSFWRFNGSNKRDEDMIIFTGNFPNPFNPSTKITYDLSAPGNVKLTIYDVLGREVKVLKNEYQNAGIYLEEFNGASLASGTYFYKLEVNGSAKINKMILMK